MAFTTKSNGQTIDASHVNELQDAVEALQAASFTPADYGFISWTMQPAAVNAAIAATASGQMWVARIRLPEAATITNISFVIETIGSSVTRSLVALYDADRDLIAQSADQGGAFGSLGIKTTALAAPQAVAAGDYYIGMWQTGTTSGRPLGSALSNQAFAIPQFASFPRWARTTSTGLTTTAPSSFTVDAISGHIPWMAVS